MRKDLADEIAAGLLIATNFHDLLMSFLVEPGTRQGLPMRLPSRQSDLLRGLKPILFS